MALPVRIYTLLLLVFYPIHSNGYSDGSVEMACTSMRPKHDGVDAQMSYPLYSLSFSSFNHTGILGFKVTLRKNAGAPDFVGFMLEARAPNGNTPMGKFIVDGKDVQTLDCATPRSAVTHTSNYAKSNVSVIWLPPVKASTSIQFRATVVQSFTKFWENVLSDVIPLAGLGSQLMAPALHHLLLCSAALIYVLFSI